MYLFESAGVQCISASLQSCSQHSLCCREPSSAPCL